MLNEKLLQGKNKALVIWTGGWNDIVSAVLVGLYLERLWIRSDIAGILSPAAIHTFDWVDEKIINILWQDTRRFISSGKKWSPKLKEISFIDNTLPWIVRNVRESMDDITFFDFSLKFWTENLALELNNLIIKNNYDILLMVDVWWDILGRWKEDPTLLSPVMDFTALHLLTKINIDSMLVEFWLWTDWELRSKWMYEIVNEIKNDDLLLGESNIWINDTEIQLFKEIFEDIAQIRRWHTATMTLQTLDSDPAKDVQSQYRYFYKLWWKTWMHETDIVLPAEYHWKVLFIDWKKFAEKRNNIAFAYKNPLEQYIKLKMIPEWKTELDLFCLWSWNDWNTTRCEWNNILLLIPSTNINTISRKEIMETWITELIQWNIDTVLFLKEDRKYISNNDLFYEEYWNFLIVYKDISLKKFANETWARICSYQIN